MKRIKGILFPLLSLILLGILFGYYLSQKKGVELLREKADELDRKIVQAQTMLKDIEFVRETTMVGERVILPPAKQVSLFLQDLTRLSEDCLVDISSLTVESLMREESSLQLSLKIELSSSCFNLGKYLKRMKTSTSLFTINSLNLRSDNSPDLRGSLTATAYLLPYQIRFSESPKSRLKWGRDPFLPPEKRKETILKPPELTLTGIVWRKEKASAIINNQILRPGDRIEGIEIIAINKKEVILKGPEGEYLLKLEKR